MKYYGDIELVDASIINCFIDPLTSLPTFDPSDEGRVIYDLTNHQLYVNNGSDYFPVQFASETSAPLVTTLGQNWINPDLSFDPTPFNTLPFISGLTSTDSLYTVIQQLAQGLATISAVTINDVSPFNVNAPQAGQILYYDGEHFINVAITNIPNFNINMGLDNLNDVVINGTPTDNQALFFNHTADNGQGDFVNANWLFLYEQLVPQSTHVVTHNLNQLYCCVTVFRTDNHTIVTPTSVTMNTAQQLTVQLSSSLPVIIYVSTIPIQN